MTTPSEQTPKVDPPAGVEKPDEAAAVIPADRLFAGQREVCIEHAGVRYRLRITRRNKLILQK
jgi:hemin uptake protein HemP